MLSGRTSPGSGEPSSPIGANSLDTHAADISPFRHTTAQQLLCGLVVEEQVSGRVHQEDRHGKGARELPHQNELDPPLRHKIPRFSSLDQSAPCNPKARLTSSGRVQ